MKILMLCNKSPWPKHEGGPIAMHAMISGLLQAGHSVKVLAANTNKYKIDPETIPADFKQNTQIEFVDIDLSLSVSGAIYNFLAGKSYHVSRFYTKAFAQKITEVLENESFDIIQLEMLQMATYLDVIRKHSKAPVVLRAHNIEHKIWQRIAENCPNPFKRIYLNHLYKSLKRFEISILNKIDGIVAITPVDARNFDRLSHSTNIISIPFGINLNTMKENPIQPAEPSLFHIGTMNWFPNEEGIKWLMSAVWPQVSQLLPDIELHLAGRYMPEWMLKLSVPRVTIDGEVPDVWEYMQRFSIMVVPLFSGSGIRIKIVEAMAAGKAIITTAIGAEGINYENGQHLIIAKDAKSFADAIVKVSNNRTLRDSLGKNAQMLITKEHDNNKLMEKLTGFYSELLQKK
ncbi:MAG: glycosyltransferase family 4 protein [Lentimicrobiaceae bacterium]